MELRIKRFRREAAPERVKEKTLLPDDHALAGFGLKPNGQTEMRPFRHRLPWPKNSKIILWSVPPILFLIILILINSAVK